MKRFKLKKTALVCLPSIALLAFCFWVLPPLFRPFDLTLNQVAYGDLFGMKGVWHYAEVTYPYSPVNDHLTGSREPPIAVKLICIDAKGHRIEGFVMEKRYSEPGKIRGATFYSFRAINLQNLKGPLHFSLETDSEEKDWKLTFPEIKIELEDLPHKTGQKITAK